VNFNKTDKKKYLWHPNLHVYPHSILLDVYDCAKSKDAYSASKIVNNLSKGHLDYLNLLKKELRTIYLWLHSWEIEEYEMWGFVKNL
jgi:hypothetical protein